MRRILALSFLFIASGTSGLAQSSNDYDKNEFFVGGLVQKVDTSGTRIPIDSDSALGFEASYTQNVSQYIGIKGDVSGAFARIALGTFVRNAPDFSLETNEKRDVYNFLGGIQIKDNVSSQRLKPFAHVLVGIGHIRTKLSTTCVSGDCTPSNLSANSFMTTGFATALGSGLDIRINDKIDIRANVDYNPIYSNDRWENGARLSFGIVFK